MAGTARSTPGSRGKVHTQRRAGREEESQGSSRPPMLLLGVWGKGPPFSRQLPKGGPGSSPCWKPPWLGWQAAQHQRELGGSRPHHKALRMGAGCGGDALQASETQSPMVPDQKQSTHGDSHSRPLHVSPLERLDGTLWGRGAKGSLETSLQLGKFLLLTHWLIGKEIAAKEWLGLCLGRTGEACNC